MMHSDATITDKIMSFSAWTFGKVMWHAGVRISRTDPGAGKNLKLAVEGNCELSSEYFAAPFLEIHRISRRLYREMVRDPSARILVLCHLCHDHIHRLPMRVKDQRVIVSYRSFFVRQDIRKILGYTPEPYTPPGNIDVPRIYEDYFYNIPPGSFRMSG